jgi:hypothetical protein
MTATQLPLDRLAEPLREPVAAYAARLQALCGPQLLAVTFYGPLRRPQPGQPTVLANAAVFRQVDLEMLARIAREGRHFGRSGIAAPWALTPELIAGSRDSFPLELLEIAVARVTVLGTDFFADLVFEPAHVRLQCERELKVIEIHLQRGLLAAAGDTRALGRLNRQLGHTMVRVLRGLAWLAGERRDRSTYELVDAVETSTGRHLSGVRQTFDDSLPASWEMFSQLHADVRALGESVEHL